MNIKDLPIENGHLEQLNQLVVRCEGRTPNEVKALVKEAIKVEEVRLLLNLIYDPLIKYNVRVPYEQYQLVPSEVPMGNAKQLLALLDKLHNRTLTGAKAKDAVWNYITSVSDQLVWFLRKNLDIGFGISSAKELGIVRAHSPQKGVLLKSYGDIKYPVYADFKYNGSRLSVSLENGKASCRLLRGNILKIPMLEQLIEARGLEGWTLDGELCKLSNVHQFIKGGLTEADRIWVSGKITSATSMNQPLSMKGMVFIVYDMIPNENFKTATKYAEPYTVRRVRLQDLITNMNHELVAISTLWKIDNALDLKRLVEWTKSIDGEGVMCKSGGSTYDFKKNKQWFKVKNIKEADLKIVGYNVHSRNENWIGSLQCEGYIDGKKITVDVGSGLNDADRPIALFDRYYGSIVMVAYMDEVQSESGEWSITNPRFVKDKVHTPLLHIIRPEGDNVNY